jgi:DNA-binding NtrC family response regulator
VAIPEALLEAELFGHERGSFTGAHARRIGQLEQADRGTVFLDEIGDIPLGVQGKLLRVLQERTLQRVGGNETIQVDVRILAATNRNLEEAIAAGSFREDLYHRLNVVTIRLPPLRDRREDIPRLARFFLDRFARELQLPKPQLADDAMALIEGHSWPGNVRELEHCIHRTLIFTGDHAIQADDLRAALADSAPDGAAPGTSDDVIQNLARSYLSTYRGPQAYERLVEQLERCLVHEALERTHGNLAHAARLLGLPRATLYGKVQKFGLGTGSEEKR